MSSDAFFQSIKLDHVRLRVADLDRARSFYQQLLGFHAASTGTSEITFSSAPGVPPLVEIEGTPEAPPRPPGAAGLFHIAFLFPKRASLGQMLTRLQSQGVRVGSADHGVSEALYLTDPEGNGIELYVDRPVTEWPRADAEGQVAMFTDPLDLESLMAAAHGTTGEAPAAGVRIGHMHLSVSSLDRAEEFYGRRLGFDVRQRSYPGALFLARDGYHHHLGVNTWRSRSSAASGSLGLARFGIGVFDHDELERILRASDEQVIGPGPRDGTLVRDFDGIEIELVESARGQRR